VLGIRKTGLLVLFMAVALAIVVAGCSDTPDRNVASKNAREKSKTVMVNKGMSKKEEKKLNERLDKLEKKLEAQDKKGSQGPARQPTENSRPEQSQQQVEDQVRAAAEAYYHAVEEEDWGYTYSHLDSETQSAFTRDEWFAKNELGASISPATFTVQYVNMDDSSPNTLANVTVLLTLEDGSTSIRNTYFVYEDGLWKHRFSSEEYEILANAKSASASASSSSSATASSSSSASPKPSPNPAPNPKPNRKVPGNAAPSGGGGRACPQGGHWVGIDGPGDGDSDGCADE